MSVGVYSSEYEWSATVGSSCTMSQVGGVDIPQWFADWDGIESFNDTTHNWGGWTTPAMKQFADGPAECNIDVDHDWYPD